MSLGEGLESLIPPQQDPSYGTVNRREDNPPFFGQEADVDVSQNAQDKEKLSQPNPNNVQIYPNATQSPQETEQVVRQTELMPDVRKTVNKPVDTEEKTDGIVFQIELDKIKPNPHQPRHKFEEESLRELAQSIREFGVIQPLVVSKFEESSERGLAVYYELIAGERRLIASKMAGLNTVPAIIRDMPQAREKLEIAIVENIQRADLNPIEFARAVARLQDEFGLTQREIAVKLGKSREVIANSVRLLSLPSEVQNAVSDGKINESQARLLLSLDDLAIRDKLFQDILRNNLSVRDLSEKIKYMKRGTLQTHAVNSTKTQSLTTTINPEIMSLLEQLEAFLGTRVEFNGKNSSGKIAISFYSPEELEAILDKLLRQNDNQSL